MRPFFCACFRIIAITETAVGYKTSSGKWKSWAASGLGCLECKVFRRLVESSNATFCNFRFTYILGSGILKGVNETRVLNDAGCH
jgi:hypothetical protein